MNYISLKLYGLRENPANYEAVVRELVAKSASDATAKALLEGLYCEANRSGAFDRYLNSLEFKTILKLMNLFGVEPTASICEIGGGPGYLAWALSQSGYSWVSLLEPSDQWFTGTGYLRTRPEAVGIEIENDLDKWYADSKLYSTIITRNVIHHFRGIAFTAACIRQKIKPGGIWIALRECYAESTVELYQKLAHHPFCQPYGAYEFAYPASHIIESMELAGFRLQAIVPKGYANDALRKHVEHAGSRRNRAFTNLIDKIIGVAPRVTTKLYQLELFSNRYLHTKFKLFTRPQVMIFQRVELA